MPLSIGTQGGGQQPAPPVAAGGSGGPLEAQIGLIRTIEESMLKSIKNVKCFFIFTKFTGSKLVIFRGGSNFII
jgi:hypothetical protein